MVNAWKTQYIISGWLHTPYQTIFMVIYWIFKISPLFDHYLENSPVKRGGQPHGSDQCGYIHLLYRSVCSFTVVEVEHLCRLGCIPHFYQARVFIFLQTRKGFIGCRLYVSVLVWTVGCAVYCVWLYDQDQDITSRRLHSVSSIKSVMITDQMTQGWVSLGTVVAGSCTGPGAGTWLGPWPGTWLSLCR